MTRRGRTRGIAGSFVTLAVALGIGLGAPTPCIACSCVAPVSLAEAVAGSPDLAVFVGKVVSLEGGADGVATVVVDGRFRGPLFTAVIRARHGSGMDCTIGMTVGDRRLFTAHLDERGVWFPGLCDPQGIQGTPEGDALLAEAIRTFGPAQPVAGQPTEPPTDLPLGLIAAAVALGIIGMLATGLVATLLVAARR